MKNFWIFLLIFWLYPILDVNAQNDTLYAYQSYSSFSNEQKAEWTAFENNWSYFDYTELKKQEHIKTLNCKNCESFYGEIYIEINEAGKVATARFKKGKRCGLPINNKQLEKAFEQSMLKQSFKTIKNQQFIVRLGHVLKC